MCISRHIYSISFSTAKTLLEKEYKIKIYDKKFLVNYLNKPGNGYLTKRLGDSRKVNSIKVIINGLGFALETAEKI